MLGKRQGLNITQSINTSNNLETVKQESINHERKSHDAKSESGIEQARNMAFDGNDSNDNKSSHHSEEPQTAHN